MINVLICDDDERFLAVLKNSASDILRSMGIPAAVYAYSRAEDITEANYQDCDIAFLDIDFRGETYSGMDIARTLRRHGSKAVIVFVTDYIQFAPEGYEVQAFRYILKDEVNSKLAPYIDQIIQYIRTTRKTLRIQTTEGSVELRTDDIYFVEAQGHILTFHVCDDNKREWLLFSSVTLARMESELVDLGFLRLHKSFLVNMAHIKKLTGEEVRLDNGTRLRVSKKMYPESRKRYMMWMGEN